MSCRSGDFTRETSNLLLVFKVMFLVDKLDRKGVGFLEAWKIPGVFYACAAFGFIKIIDYGLLFWLPDYLD